MLSRRSHPRLRETRGLTHRVFSSSSAAKRVAGPRRLGSNLAVDRTYTTIRDEPAGIGRMRLQRLEVGDLPHPFRVIDEGVAIALQLEGCLISRDFFCAHRVLPVPHP